MYKYGKILTKRRGIYGGHLNLRRRGSKKEIQEWIKYYKKQLQNGSFCPIRGEKILQSLEQKLVRFD